VTDIALRHQLVVTEVRRRWRNNMLFAGGIVLIILLSLWYGGFFELQRYAKGINGVVSIIVTEGLPPDFTRWRSWLVPLLDTAAMSIAGTAGAILIALSLCVFAAANTTPHTALYVVSRMILNTLRAFPELIMGIILLAAVGLGILPGILALVFHSAGMIGKFFAETMEHVDQAPVEAVRACGGNSIQVLTHGIFPQVLPQFADVCIYRWECNFRASTVMGMVGCGGIGFELHSALSIMEYRQVTALLMLVVACVTVVDGCGIWLRRYFK